MTFCKDCNWWVHEERFLSTKIVSVCGRVDTIHRNTDVDPTDGAVYVVTADWTPV